MMSKIIITTSRRPTPVVRRFIKHLVPIIPNARYQRRGKLTLSLLILQAIDFNVDKVIVVRNRKGNPGYLDTYLVDPINKTLIKLCTLYICSFSIRKTQPKINPKLKPNQLLILSSALALIDNEKVAECLLRSFNIKVCDEVPEINLKSLQMPILIDVRKYFKEKHPITIPLYEIIFKNFKNEIVGPVIRICKAKIYTKAV